jgi:hypothetical protein
MSLPRRLQLTTVLVLALSCAEQRDTPGHARSDAVASASREMSGPSLFSSEALAQGLTALRTKAGGKALRLEIRPSELVLQAEDLANPGGVVEYHYQNGKVGDAEHATLRGKGQLADNLFDLGEVRLEALSSLTRAAVERVDPESGSVELVLVRRNLPESDDVRVRVYVHSPRKSGHVDADRLLEPL